MGHPELEEETVIKKNGLSLGISIFFLGGTMAGTGVLALARAMVDTGITISIFYLGETMAGSRVLALARAMVDTGIQPTPSSSWVGPWLALESWL